MCMCVCLRLLLLYTTIEKRHLSTNHTPKTIKHTNYEILCRYILFEECCLISIISLPLLHKKISMALSPLVC